MKTWKNKFQKVLAILLAICLVTGFMEVSQVQAATKKSGTTYYYTHLVRQKGGRKLVGNKYYYDTGTMKVVCKGNTLTMYSSFNKSKNRVLNTSKKNFVKYGKHTFKLTSKTKYFSLEFNPENPDKPYRNNYSKSRFVYVMKRLNGLGLWIKVKDGKVVSMQLCS